MEVIAVPIPPGRDDLGSFGTTFVNNDLSLVTTSEFGRTRGSNSRVYVTRITAAGKEAGKQRDCDEETGSQAQWRVRVRPLVSPTEALAERGLMVS
ncbi:MAG: hypothetical protein Q8M07_08380 [Prosthecobacter sp.]|nr:hypothetical protein [Prosthecobacter sp.]